MGVNLNKWVPGEEVDNDELVREELGNLRNFRNTWKVDEELDKQQNSRIAALKASREVLSEKAVGAFSSNTKAVDTFDLVAVAGWIMNGEDPWPAVKEYPYGKCDVCGFPLSLDKSCAYANWHGIDWSTKYEGEKSVQKTEEASG